MQNIDLKETLQDHEQRIRKLEEGSIRVSEKMENVCKKSKVLQRG